MMSKLTRPRKLFFFVSAAIVSFYSLQIAEACTRILWNDNKFGVFAARSMDWPQSTEPMLFVFPKGITRNGANFGSEIVVKDNPAVWTSQYGSMVTAIYGRGAADGFNEKGLAIHMLYLNATDYGPRDISKQGLQVGMWGQYALDNAATVAEALDKLAKIQPVMVTVNGFKGTVHLVLEDVSGDSALIEYIDGKAVLHHDKKMRVVTNDPPYTEQLTMLSKLDFSHPQSTTPLPGNMTSADRLERASYFLQLLPQPNDEREAVASIMAVARNVSVPFGAPYKNFGIYDTEYRTVINFNDQRYYFELTTSPSVIWADLKQFDLSAGSSVLAFDPRKTSLSGNVSNAFNKIDKAPF
ncbi:linear amide C-N hydrolase [Yersinia intermedia]|uniref:linear amide C-N hydrolase n=1 Tax=Yersinia intermedia TaxID=631 RepID=UPI001F537183|nr:linear amide C-N hydrolase [Yersinia intermedia]UNK24753.1 linear amide C-N hydrolase [Yersinia intermedia]